MINLAHPHDRLFTALMSTPEIAGALLREYMPQEIVAVLAPEDPELVLGSFISEELRPYYSDRMFRAKTLRGKSVYFYTLMEHKSYLDRKVGQQLHRGISRFIEQKEQENPEWTLLPAIIPFVLYHDAQEWTIPNEFLSLVDADEALRPWLMNFSFVVVNLGPIPDNRLARNARLKAGLMALKYGTRDPKIQNEALWAIVAALEEAPELLVPIMLYLLTTFQDLDESDVREIVVRVCPQETSEMISVFARNIVEQHKHEWRQEGFESGERRGERNRAIQTLLRLLTRRFGELPAEVHTKVNAANIDILESWTDQLLDAHSLDDVFH
ncbi:MAG: Rpn family recombination-promoting nuclease/putative transposase [Magnetococcales bacterium]|nr:Rpn family recombination-promoting nuclease/putative transposase [Magnetococcales bacterium]